MTLGNPHNIVDSHEGELDDAQIAGGTAADGDVPISNGDGTRTWGPGGGSSDIYLENDDVTFPNPVVKFKDNVALLTSDTDTEDEYASLALRNSVPWAELYAQANAGADYSNVLLAGDSGTVEMYASTDVLMFPDGSVQVGPSGDIVLDAGSDVDASSTTGGLIFPVHTSDPTPAEGMAYYNSSTDKLRLYANGAWVDLN